MSTWQPIATAPKDGTEVICVEIDPRYFPYYAVAAYYEIDGRWRPNAQFGGDMTINPTLWMPLPPLPEGL